MAKSLKTLSAIADEYYIKQKERLALAKEVEKLDKEEKNLKRLLMQELRASGSTSVAGSVARVSLKEKDVYQVDDWDDFWRGFRKGRDYDLLQHRLSTKAVELRFEANKKIPGVKKETVLTLSLNKI